MDRIEKIKEFLQKSPHDSFLQHALALEYIKKGDDVAGRAKFEALVTHGPGEEGKF